MKKKSITVLSVLLIVCFLLCLLDGAAGARDGWNDASSDLSNESQVETHRVEVSLEPITASHLPNVMQLASEKQIPYGLSSVLAKVEEQPIYSIASTVVALIFTPLLIGLVIWGGLSFFHFIRDVRKGIIFIPLNVRRLRVISGFLILVALLQNVTKGLDYFLLIKGNGLEFPGYRIVDFHFQYETFFIALFFALFAEIFALGVRMKEEQDLTI